MGRLEQLCRQYVRVISQIENSYLLEYWEVQELEELRATLHYNVMQAMDNLGIQYRDRFDVTQIAYQIAG